MSTESEYRCPECGSDNVQIAATVWCRLLQTEDGIETKPCDDNQDHDWDGESSMICEECRHSGQAILFWNDPADVPIHTISRQSDRVGMIRWDCVLVLAAALAVAAITLLWEIH